MLSFQRVLVCVGYVWLVRYDDIGSISNFAYGCDETPHWIHGTHRSLIIFWGEPLLRPHPSLARLNCLTNTDPNLLPFTTLYWVMPSNSIIWTLMYPMRCFVAPFAYCYTVSRLSVSVRPCCWGIMMSTRLQGACSVEERRIDCMEDITQLMSSNRLKLNPAKTSCGVWHVGDSTSSARTMWH